jgi:hypothetical protein
MFERRVERAKDGRHCGNKQQQCSARAGHLPRLQQNLVIALDVLQNVYRDECIDGLWRRRTLQVALYGCGSLLICQAPGKDREVVVAGLDCEEPLYLRKRQQQLGEGSSSGPYLKYFSADVGGKPPKQPAIIVLRAGKSIELRPGVDELRWCKPIRPVRSPQFVRSPQLGRSPHVAFRLGGCFRCADRPRDSRLRADGNRGRVSVRASGSHPPDVRCRLTSSAPRCA